MLARPLLAASLAGLLVALVPAPAAAQGTTIELEAHDGGGEFWFQIAGQDARNPSLAVEPGAEVTVRLRNVGDAPHNVAFTGLTESVPCCLAPGADASVTFTAPAEDVTLTYFCAPHRGAGMLGPLVVGAGSPETGGFQMPDLGGIGPGTRGFGLVLALVVGLGVAVMFTRDSRREA